MKKNQRVRYIVFRDGEFFETVHNKESYYLSTQTEEKEQNQDSQMDVNQNGDNLNKEIKKRKIKNSFLSIGILAILIVGFGFLFTSFNQKIEDSLPHLNINSTEIITDTSTIINNEAKMDQQMINELTYALHTHHSINTLYEEAKMSVSKYASGSISHIAFENELSAIATQIKTLKAYNEVQTTENEQLKELYQTTSVRLDYLLELLREVVTTKSRVLVVQTLNNGIELDKPLFNSQLTNFKSILDSYGIGYTETANYLVFEFPK